MGSNASVLSNTQNKHTLLRNYVGYTSQPIQTKTLEMQINVNTRPRLWR